MATTEGKEHHWRLWETVRDGAYIKYLRCALCGSEVNASTDARNDEQPGYLSYFGRHRDTVRA